MNPGKASLKKAFPDYGHLCWCCHLLEWFSYKKKGFHVIRFYRDRTDGGGLARNLIHAGKEVLVYDLNPEAVKNVRSWQRGWVRQRGLHLQNVRMDLGKEVMDS